MKLKFVTGEVIVVKDEALLKLLLADKRYTEVKSAPKKEDKE